MCVMGGASATPEDLSFTSSAAGKWEDELDAMHCAESALGKVSLLLKAHFVPGKVVYAQFDGRF